MKVGLDPGHGGTDPGAVKGSFVEKAMNLEVALKVKKLLEGTVKVFMTRSSDVFVALKDRTHMLDNADTDLNISIHHNGAATEKAKGFEIYYFTGSKQGELLAKSLEAEFIKSRPKRYVGPGMMAGSNKGDYWMTRSTRAPTLITEYGFVTSPIDQAEMNMDKQAHEIATGVLNYLKVPTLTDEDIVDRLVAKGLINTKSVWIEALKTGVVKPEFLRILIKNFLSL